MSRRCLAGHLILLVEDELLIALHLQDALRTAGGKVVSAGYLEAGLYMSDHPALSAAVVDLHLGKGDGIAVCQRLWHLGVPFIVHTAHAAHEVKERWPNVPVIHKPARVEAIVAALARLLD